MPFQEAAGREATLDKVRMRDLGLTSAGTQLEPILAEVERRVGGGGQKHPDEDWAETFAVWMTPGLDWRAEYAGWPVALAKLTYCDRTMAALQDRDPLVTATDLDEDVGELTATLGEYYAAGSAGTAEL